MRMSINSVSAMIDFNSGMRLMCSPFEVDQELLNQDARWRLLTPGRQGLTMSGRLQTGHTLQRMSRCSPQKATR